MSHLWDLWVAHNCVSHNFNVWLSIVTFYFFPPQLHLSFYSEVETGFNSTQWVWMWQFLAFTSFFIQPISVERSSTMEIEQKLQELNRQSAEARAKLLELIEQQKQSTSLSVSPAISPVPPHSSSTHTGVSFNNAYNLSDPTEWLTDVWRLFVF